MEIVLLSIVLLGLGFLGMAFNIVFRKKKFPDSHISHNKEMKKRGIVCAKTMDRVERKKLKDGLRFKGIQLIQK
jgi:hypothetical protein